jgi:hypothetical protein
MDNQVLAIACRANVFANKHSTPSPSALLGKEASFTAGVQNRIAGKYRYLEALAHVVAGI